MTKKADKARGHRYSASEKAKALKLYQEIGGSATSRRLSIPSRTLKRWADQAGVSTNTVVPPKDQIIHAHAATAQRVADKWGDLREAEADEAGRAAQEVRVRLLELLVGDDAQMLRAVTDAYRALIDKAEALSGQASERIAIWAEQDIDRELKELMKEMEADRRRELPASKKALLASEDDDGEPEDDAVVIDVSERNDEP